MKKKMLVMLSLVLTITLLMAGCKPTEEKPDTSDKLGDMLQVSSTVFNQLEGGYNEYLEASRQYGKLVPYIGKRTLVNMGGGHHEEYNWWGFCTTEGLVVTDAVYSNVQWFETEAGNGIYVMERIDEDDPTTLKAWMAADDGKWVVSLGENGYLVDCGNSRIVTSVADVDDSTPYSIYDFYGNLVHEIRPLDNEQIYMDGFSGGYAFLDRLVSEGDAVTPYGCYINRNGNEVFPYTFSSGQPFENGKAIVCDVNGFYGILKDNGTWFIEPGYEHIQRYGDYFVLDDGYDCMVLDDAANEIARFIGTGNVFLTIGKDEVLYSTTDDNTLRYLRTRAPVINADTRKSLRDYDWSTSTLLSQVDEKAHVLYVMSYDGTVKYTVEDHGESFTTEDYIIVQTHSDSDTVKWVDIDTGKVKLTTDDTLIESAQDGWYYRDNGKTNATLYQMATGKQIKFPADQLIVQEIDGSIYYQIYNETQMILMNEDMDVLVKLSNKK